MGLSAPFNEYIGLPQSGQRILVSYSCSLNMIYSSHCFFFEDDTIKPCVVKLPNKKNSKKKRFFSSIVS